MHKSHQIFLSVRYFAFQFGRKIEQAVVCPPNESQYLLNFTCHGDNRLVGILDRVYTDTAADSNNVFGFLPKRRSSALVQQPPSLSVMVVQYVSCLPITCCYSRMIAMVNVIFFILCKFYLLLFYLFSFVVACRHCERSEAIQGLS